jgi:hypothetical protein
MSDPSFTAGMPLPASQLQELGLYGSWTPTLTASSVNPTLGVASSADGIYHRNGKLITVTFKIVFGSSGTAAGTGNYGIGGLPFSVNTLANVCNGYALAGDASTGDNYPFWPLIASSTSLLMLSNVDAAGAAGTTEKAGLISAAVPVAWTVGDSFQGMFTYISA